MSTLRVVLDCYISSLIKDIVYSSLFYKRLYYYKVISYIHIYKTYKVDILKVQVNSNNS